MDVLFPPVPLLARKVALMAPPEFESGADGSDAADRSRVRSGIAETADRLPEDVLVAAGFRLKPMLASPPADALPPPSPPCARRLTPLSFRR